MHKPVRDRWTYDRSASAEVPGYTTFSVGLFQWLPKAAGGLKKSKTIRVTGYVDDADAVYRKCDELCDRLNAENVRLDDPPAWLQKSYSAGKPPATVVRRKRDGLSPAQVRRIREKVAKAFLIGAGFVRTDDGTYARLVGEWSQLIYFQGSQYGRDYTINLALHPTWAMPHFAQRRISWKSLRYLDCGIAARIGRFLSPAGDTWFTYEADAASFAKTRIDLVDKSRSVLDRHSAGLADPARLLGPSTEFLRPFECFQRDELLLACTEARSGRLDHAESRLRHAIAEEGPNFARPYESLLKVIGKLRTVTPGGAESERLIRWLTC